MLKTAKHGNGHLKKTIAIPIYFNFLKNPQIPKSQKTQIHNPRNQKSNNSDRTFSTNKMLKTAKMELTIFKSIANSIYFIFKKSKIAEKHKSKIKNPKSNNSDRTRDHEDDDATATMTMIMMMMTTMTVTMMIKKVLHIAICQKRMF